VWVPPTLNTFIIFIKIINIMNIISTRVHAWLDYLTGLFILAAPWIFQMQDSEAGSWVFIMLGSTVLITSLFTNYEGGVVRHIPMSVHLNLDIVLGAVTAASPWIFGFAEEGYVLHLVIGLFSIAAGLATSRKPFIHHPADSGNEHVEFIKESTPVDTRVTD
jgi:hypothetical protein